MWSTIPYINAAAKMELKMNKKWLVVGMILGTLLGVPAIASASTQATGAAPNTATPPTVDITYENGIHYVVDPGYPDKKITLFCMNNKLQWPHHTEGMGELQVPSYTDGYLTPDDFSSRQEYDECMRRLTKLLYAGYPYNGEDLYKIVENSSEYALTEAEFNKLLVCPPVLQTAYPYLGHHDFTYEDWKSQKAEHLEHLRQFVAAAIKLQLNGGTTSNGLTWADISAMPFYKAAFSIINCNNQTPLEAFKLFYGASYFVTEEEAYNATQSAVWHLMYTYKVADNDIDSLPTPLSEVLFTYSERGGLLDHKPSVDELTVTGDKTFTYNPKDGMWHSGILRINEPEGYRGLYRFTFPKGYTAQCDNLTYVYGNEDYEIVSDHEPKLGEQIGITADFKWLQELKQYSPSEPIQFEGKKFQNMAGAVVSDARLTFSIGLRSDHVGGVSITKKVTGEANCTERFGFKVSVFDMADPEKPVLMTDLNGLYGDLVFQGGVAEFDLRAGETRQMANVPAGSRYVIEEVDLGTPGAYRPAKPATGTMEGIVETGETHAVEFVNEKIPTTPEGPGRPEQPQQPDDQDQPNGQHGKDDTTDNSGSRLPQTGDNSLVVVGGVAALAVALLGFGLFLRSRKK